MDSKTQNPVVKETQFASGWTVREYANGMFDAHRGGALTIGYPSFVEVRMACEEIDLEMEMGG